MRGRFKLAGVDGWCYFEVTGPGFINLTCNDEMLAWAANRMSEILPGLEELSRLASAPRAPHG